MPRSIPVKAFSPAPPLWPWRIALVLSLIPLVAAAGMLAFPDSSTATWGWPPPTTATHHIYLTLLSARELYVAATALVLWLCGEVRAVGWVLVLVGVLPAADGWVAWQNGATWSQILQHWGAIPITAAVGYPLINAR